LVKSGDLFFCISGQRMDGHNFAGQAAEKGAAAIVSHKPMPEIEIPVMLVEDTIKALGRLGRCWRIKKGKKVVAVTGSAGKTTTKEMISEILGVRYLIGKNYKNWNNQLGLPLSILNFNGDEDYWVLELGINNPNDMDELAWIACPDIAVILNVGPCHLQGLGSIEGVARSKSVLLDYLTGTRKAIVSLDYPYLKDEVASKKKIVPVWFSCDRDEADYMVTYKGSDEFEVIEHGQSFSFSGSAGWSQYCENIAASWAVARDAGLDQTEIIKGLKKFSSPDQRFSISTNGAWTIIDDTYNANPLSMDRAINTARDIAEKNNLVLVLGDMAELGEDEKNVHKELGRKISKVGCKGILFQGKNAEDVLGGLDMDHKHIFYEVDNETQFITALNSLDLCDGTVLFKGSRSTRMEKYISFFKNWMQNRP
ncbi:MAG: UDP-N-acetylmuramoyl-tripeptide--D-alanyl-D-alanine ligase, partial [Desulfonatronovibrio sp.]